MFRLTRDDNPARPGPKGEKDIQKLAEKISKFAHKTHAAYPTGDVIVAKAISLCSYASRRRELQVPRETRRRR